MYLRNAWILIGLACLAAGSSAETTCDVVNRGEYPQFLREMHQYDPDPTANSINTCMRASDPDAARYATWVCKTLGDKEGSIRLYYAYGERSDACTKRTLGAFMSQLLGRYSAEVRSDRKRTRQRLELIEMERNKLRISKSLRNCHWNWRT